MPRPLTSSLRPLCLAATLIFGATGPAIAQPSLQDPAPLLNVSLKAQPLAQALNDLARQADIQVLFQPAAVSGKSAPSLTGKMSLREALSRLLVGTGLVARGDGNIITIAENRTQAETAQLSPVTVVGQRVNDLTEDTHSYAANAVSIGKGGTQSLREIPQSVSVITSQQIEDQSLATVQDALQQTPGLYVAGVDTTKEGRTYYSRGFPVVYSYDGLSTNNDGVFNTSAIDDLAIVDHVEVLKGPAALLRNAGNAGITAGTVNVVRKKPKKEFGLAAEASAGSWNNYRGVVDVTGPLNNTASLRGRAVLATNDRDFFYGTKSHRRSWTAYGVIEADLTSNTLLSVSATHGESREDQPLTGGIWRYKDGEIFSHDRSLNINSEDGYANVTNTILSTTLSHKFDNDWEIKGSIIYRETEENSDVIYGSEVDRATLTTNYTRWSYNPYETKAMVYDVNASGPITLFGRTHNLTFGFEGSRFKSRYSWAYQGYSNQPIYNPTYDISTTPNYGGTYYENEYPQKAFYGVGRFRLSDSLTLIGGARISDYESRARTIQSGASTDWKTSTKATNEVSPYGGLIWDVNESVSLYASYADIFAPQSNVSYGGGVLPPRVGWQGEIGGKGSFFNNRLNASIALYRIRDTNRPILDDQHQGCGGSPTSPCYNAAGLVQSQGIDVEVSGSPMRGLQLTAGYTYNQNKYLADSTESNVGAQFNGLTPRHLFKFWGTYHFTPQDLNGALSGWHVGAGVVAQSDTYRSPTIRQGGYAVVNAVVGYQINSKTSLALNVNNVFDREYTMYGYYWGEPANFMLTLRHQFY